MKELQECIKRHTTNNINEIQECITNMVCLESDPIPLSKKVLIDALESNGEFLVLKLHYNDFKDELRNQKLKYKISQSLSIIVSYEDDGKSFQKINDFVKYIYDISDDKQISIFGVKKVKKLTTYPITILFAGILPINQLSMTYGKKIDEFIHSDDRYFKPRFKKLRDDISKEIGIRILPILPILDENLNDFQVRLVDQIDGRIISDFQLDNQLNKDVIESYLLKLFYIYKTLAQNCKTDYKQ
jgi:hypothetical protein